MGDDRNIDRYTLARTGERKLSGLEADWAAELNEQQLAAVSAPDGPVLVLAGAGSGKTRVITHRVAYLLAERRLKPQNILLLTFTNKAARSMLSRVEQVVGPEVRDVTGGTFHHFANLQLRRYARMIDYENNFSILDESDSVSVMKLCRSERGLDKAERAFPSAKLLTKIASMMVNTNSDLETVITRRFPHLFESYNDIEQVLIDFHQRKRANNQMDFDDLLVNLFRLLIEHPKVRAAMSRRFVHVLVDEYQDVNHLQAAIVRELYLGESGAREEPAAEQQDGEDASTEPRADKSRAPLDDGLEILPADAPLEGGTIPEPSSSDTTIPVKMPEHRGLFVVGDDAQSIYSFRGADYKNIRSFHAVFAGTRIYKLETNYRSTPQVLSLANGVMHDADPQFKKELRAVKSPGDDRPLLLGCNDVAEQAEFVAEQVLALREEQGIDYRQIAVLYRAHNNRLEVELEFTQRGIPFVVRGGLRFFEQAHMKDILSYLLVIANGRDELAWQRMMDMCSRVGPKTIAKVLGYMRGSADEEGGMIGRFLNNGAADQARGQAKNSLAELREFLRELSDAAPKLPVPDLIKRVLDGRYRHYLEVNYENWRQRLDDLEQLVVFANRFDSLQDFLVEIGLSTDISAARSLGETQVHDVEEGAVTLSTVHQAKGLEWQVVFIIHCHDEVIPHRMTHGLPEEEDEERRLLYVAITRAEELLYMSYPLITETRDFQRIINKPSRFLADLPGDSYDEATLDWSENN